MESYTRHRRLASQIVELAELLGAEADAFHRAVEGRGRAKRVAQAVDRSTDWLQQTSGALLLGMAALREAADELQRTRRSKRGK